MRYYKYLIIGGGITADAATQGIREIDPDGSIGIIAAEDHSPYDRPPLSKGLWSGELTLDDIWRDTGNRGVQLHLSRRATSLIPLQKRVFDHEGASYTYEKLLLATGCNQRQIKDSPRNMIYYRTIDDYFKLKQAIETQGKIGIVGGGFIGAEIAAALNNEGKNVTIIFPENGICQSIFPRDVSAFLNDYYSKQGVNVIPNTLVKGTREDGGKIVLSTSSEGELTFEVVVGGIGVTPEVTIAKSAGLEIDNGIVVDQYLSTSKQDIYAAGDVARVPYPALGKALRFEHEDNANATGLAAGRNMAGASKPYDHLPMFYSDMFDIGYEAVGEINSNLAMVADWKEEFEEGLIYYLEGNYIQGVLSWNVYEKVDAARELIKARMPVNQSDVVGSIPFE